VGGYTFGNDVVDGFKGSKAMKRIALFAAAVTLCGVASFTPIMPVAAQALHQTQFDDGTGSIGLPEGWHISGAYRGAVQCTGPNGAAIVMKMPWAILSPQSSLMGLPAAQQTPVAMPGDIMTALREVLQKKVGASLKSVRASRVRGASPAYYLLYEYVQGGRSYTALGYFAPLTYGPSSPSWQLYSSAVVAPTPVFPKMLRTMLSMWRSWHPNGEEPLEGSSSAIFDKIMKQKRLSQEIIQEQFREQL